MENSNFIPGIYNHCDRWCERCELVHRCKLGTEDLAARKKVKSNEDFVEIISKNLTEVFDLLNQIAREKGFNIEDIEIDEKTYEKEQQKYEDARQHPLSKLAHKYTDQSHQFWKDTQQLKAEKEKCLHQIELGINSESANDQLRKIEEAENIIQWYHFQIPVKMISAIQFFPHDPDFEDEVQNMYHSSAKVTLIGIENSIKAWHTLLQITAHESTILLLLSQLQQLEKSLKRKYPKLPLFKRPGFDD